MTGLTRGQSEQDCPTEMVVTASVCATYYLHSGTGETANTHGGDIKKNLLNGGVRGARVNPLDGEFTLISSNNYEAFLAKVGAGPFSINLVQRARINLTIKQVRPEAGGLYYHVVHAGAGQALEHPLRDSDQGQVQQGIQDQSLEGDSEQVPAGGGEAGVSGRLGPEAAHVQPLLEREGQQAHTTPGCRERSGKTVCHILT